MLVDWAHQTHEVSCKNEAESDQIIQYISGYAPYLVPDTATKLRGLRRQTLRRSYSM